MARRTVKTKQNNDKNKQKGLFPGDDALRENPAKILQGFLQYGWDLLGIFLIAGGLILLLGFIGVTSGTLIIPLTRFLTRWFGLGRYLLVVVMIVIGLKVVRWRKNAPETIHLKQIISFELAFFFFIGALSIMDGGSVADAEAGLDLGGILGWGIAEIFRATIGPTAGFVVIMVFLSISLIASFKVIQRLEPLVLDQVGKVGVTADLSKRSNSAEKSSMVDEPEQEDETEVEKPKKSVWLPPEFRKSFEAPDIADEQPDQPLERSSALPPLDLLAKGEMYKPDKRAINLTAGLIEKTLDEFGIPAKVVGFRTGPTVTQFAVEPGYINKDDDDRHKIRVSQISSLQRDLALALSAERLRIEAPVPGKSYVGIEIPNPNSTVVQLRSLIESEAFYRVNSHLALTLGRDVSGRPDRKEHTSEPPVT